MTCPTCKGTGEPLSVQVHGSATCPTCRTQYLTAAEAERRRHAVSGPSTETVNHPAHYGGDTTYEAIKVIEAWQLDFCLGNTVKYICRAGKKGNELEDLLKAQWYLGRRIRQLNQRSGTS